MLVLDNISHKMYLGDFLHESYTYLKMFTLILMIVTLCRLNRAFKVTLPSPESPHLLAQLAYGVNNSIWMKKDGVITLVYSYSADRTSLNIKVGTKTRQFETGK